MDQDLLPVTEEEENQKRYEKLMENIFHDTTEYGHSVIGIFDAPVPYSYTAGRSIRGKPELMVSGPLRMDLQAKLLNLVADCEANGEVVLQPGLVKIRNKQFKLVPIDPENYGMIAVAIIVGGEGTTAMQLQIPDLDGYFPGEEGFAEVFSQPQRQDITE